MAALVLGIKLSPVGRREEEIRSRRPFHCPSWRWQRGMERRRIYPAGPRLILAALPHGQVLQIAHTWTKDHNRALVFVCAVKRRGSLAGASPARQLSRSSR